MKIEKLETPFAILIAALWAVIMVLGWTGHFIWGMVLGVALMFLHMTLGIQNKGIAPKKFLVYPMLIWAALWITSFLLSKYFGDKYAGVMPPLFLGMHPSFAPTVYLYWIGGQLTLNLGMYLMRDEWLSEEKWQTFLSEVKALDAAK